ncbi:hypothetical protein AVEN_110872-1 [Araneus ventricosus]|uniref:Uncharacterized protein n=1 Tax=Araneus ventricosus TaxID=182803 RepID=A0A4Y2NKQ3_ARAVE|nr:hypothetical protein AVEN_110872-1 [Araneus ventricosus]
MSLANRRLIPPLSLQRLKHSRVLSLEKNLVSILLQSARWNATYIWDREYKNRVTYIALQQVCSDVSVRYFGGVGFTDPSPVADLDPRIRSDSGT